jgi:hypothetical protein
MAKKPPPKVVSAAKRAAKKANTKKKSKVVKPKVATKPKVTTPAKPEPTAPVKVPVAGADGSLVSPETWQQDQARLTALREDQDALENIENEEASAALDYDSKKAEYDRDARQRRLDIQKQKQGFQQQKNYDKADLNSNLSYRGAARSSAASRKFSELTSQHAAVDKDLTDAEADTNLSFDVAAPELANTKKTRLSLAAERRRKLAERAAAKGSYTAGTKPVGDTGIVAPKAVVIKKPGSRYNPDVLGGKKKKAAVKKNVIKKPSKKAVVSAARRKVGKK